GGGIEFAPRYPLSRSVVYRVRPGARLQAMLGEALPPEEDPVWQFRLPAAPPQPPTQVVAIYPSAGALPENVLKFYIHFSAPMSRGEAYRRVHLYRGDEPIEDPFLELGEELWDADQTRFTLFIHPG